MTRDHWKATTAEIEEIVGDAYEVSLTVRGVGNPVVGAWGYVAGNDDMLFIDDGKQGSGRFFVPLAEVVAVRIAL